MPLIRFLDRDNQKDNAPQATMIKVAPRITEATPTMRSDWASKVMCGIPLTITRHPWRTWKSGTMRRKCLFALSMYQRNGPNPLPCRFQSSFVAQNLHRLGRSERTNHRKSAIHRSWRQLSNESKLGICNLCSPFRHKRDRKENREAIKTPREQNSPSLAARPGNASFAVGLSPGRTGVGRHRRGSVGTKPQHE